MRIIVKGKNFDVPEADRAYADRKLRRLERLLDDRSEAQAECSLERHKSIQDSHIVDVTLVIDGRPLRSVAQAATQMVRQHIHRVMITDSGQRLLGIVSTTDVLRALAEGVEQ